MTAGGAAVSPSQCKVSPVKSRQQSCAVDQQTPASEMDLPARIESEIGDLCQRLESLGYRVVETNVGPMDCYEVRLAGPAELFIGSDRGYLSAYRRSGPPYWIESDVSKWDTVGVNRFKSRVLEYATEPGGR